MRRVVDASQPVETQPAIDPVMPPAPPPPHKEPYGPERNRANIMSLLRIQPAQISDPALDLFEQVTAAIDPAGTHVETYYPIKWFYDNVNNWAARDVAHLPVKTLVNEAIVVDVGDFDRAIGPADFEVRAAHLKEGDNVLLRSGLNERWKDSGLHPDVVPFIYGNKEIGISVEAARWLTRRNIRMCALDWRDPEDPANRHELPTHAELHLNNVLIVEDIANLKALSQERVLLLTGTPVKLRHMTGGIARIVAIETAADGSWKPIDLTHVLGAWPEPPATRRRVELVEDRQLATSRADLLFFEVGWGGWSDVVGPQYVRFSTQLGTHLVNPGKWVDGGGASPLFGDVSEIPLDRLIGPGCLLDLSYVGPRQVIRRADIQERGGDIQGGDWVVLRTDYDWHRQRESYLENSPVLDLEAVDELARRGVKGIIGDLSQLSSLQNRWDLQAALHERNMLAVESAWHLWLVRKPRFNVAVLPAKIKGLVSSPAQVFILEEWT